MPPTAKPSLTSTDHRVTHMRKSDPKTLWPWNMTDEEFIARYQPLVERGLNPNIYWQAVYEANLATLEGQAQPTPETVSEADGVTNEV